MLSPFRYFILFCIVIATYTAPALASDAEKQAKLEELKNSINELKKQLEKTKSSRDAIAQDLEQSEKNVSNLSKKAKGLKSSLSKEKNKLNTLKNERSELKKNKNEQQQFVANYINAAYRAGKKSQLHLLLNQQSPDDLSRTLKYYDYFIKARSQKIDSFLNTIQRLNNIEPEITASATRLEQKIQDLAQQQTKLQTAQNQRRIHLTKLNSELNDQSSALEKLTSDRNRLEELISRVSEYIDDVETSPAAADIDFVKLKGKLPWPTTGKVISSFGSRRVDKLKWQGIRISGTNGADIKAIHSGRVIFSDYLRGHGLLIILDHGSGFMTLYAHNQSLYKELGEWVGSGEPIASLGNSGGQQRSALYFELRRNGRPDNPLRWLKSA